MLIPAKGAVIAAVAVIGVGGTVTLASTGAISLNSNPADKEPPITRLPDQPTWKPVWKDKDFSTTYKENDFGHDYQDLFVGAEETSKDWWDNAYAKFKSEGSHEEFKGTEGITSAFSINEEDRALNQVCKSFYKQEADKVEGRSKILTGHFRFQKSNVDKDIWKYCSPLGENPIPEARPFHRGKVWNASKGDIAHLAPGTLAQLLLEYDENEDYLFHKNSFSYMRWMSIMLDKSLGLAEYKDKGPAAESKEFSEKGLSVGALRKVKEGREQGIRYYFGAMNYRCNINTYIEQSNSYWKTNDREKTKNDIYKFCTLKGKVDNTHTKHYLTMLDSMQTKNPEMESFKGKDVALSYRYSFLASTKNEKNKEWWESTFAKLQEDKKTNLDSLFSKLKEVDKAWSDSKEDTKALNQTCDSMVSDINLTEEEAASWAIDRAKGNWKFIKNPPKFSYRTSEEKEKFIPSLKKYCVFEMNKREEALFDWTFSTYAGAVE